MKPQQDSAHPEGIVVRRMRPDTYVAFHGSRKVGALILWRDVDDPACTDVSRAYEVVVDKGLRRHGVATLLYDRAEVDLAAVGLRLMPSPSERLTDDAYGFWRARPPERVAADPRGYAPQYVGREVRFRDFIGERADGAFIAIPNRVVLSEFGDPSPAAGRRRGRT